MWNLKNKINEQTKEKNTRKCRVHFNGYPMGGGLVVSVKKLKGLRSTNWQLQNSGEDVKCSIGSIVNSVIIIMYGVRWVLDLSGGSLCKLYKYLTTILIT